MTVKEGQAAIRAARRLRIVSDWPLVAEIKSTSGTETRTIRWVGLHFECSCPAPRDCWHIKRVEAYLAEVYGPAARRMEKEGRAARTAGPVARVGGGKTS